MAKITWADIFIDAANLDFVSLLALWPLTVTGSLRPIGASVFGDLFFERQSGQIEKLDVLEGGVRVVANNMTAFRTLMNTVTWQESELLRQGIALLQERGLVRLSNQFFALAPHPALVGKIDWNCAITMDSKVWHSICAQLLDSIPQS